MGHVVRTTRRELSAEHIRAVLKKEALVVQIKGFLRPEALEIAREQLFDHAERGELSQAAEFGRVGFAYSEIGDEASRRAYHERALPNIHRLRELFAPYLSPTDELRLLLDEIWPQGANLLHVDGAKCFVGIARYQDKDVDLNPHTDALERNLPPDHQSDLQAQLSVNVYVNIPDEGGELELWGIEPTEDEYRTLVGDRAYGIDRDKVSDPVAVVKPEAGDLILLNPRLIHAVRPSQDSSRITIGHFIGYLGEERPLALWS
ncbi:2OG-Fe(II) oxygenase [Actinomadura kijaniata]|uniref:2OG-Fe(II) oxygenase n=1 Tax=Actinomadura kijaniata TaxID=46161 RepID=UPI00083450BB|nr:2OG-Fe(II) oxygenase [Actinomadura kijaniata]